jgi:xanthosine utilization system XapX-like protein
MQNSLTSDELGLTLAVTFIFGLAFPKESIPIGFGTGLWLGLIFVLLPIVERVPTGVSLAVICILCGYLGANLSLCVRNLVCGLTGIGANS